MVFHKSNNLCICYNKLILIPFNFDTKKRNPYAIKARGANSPFHLFSRALFNENSFDTGLLILQPHGFPQKQQLVHLL